MRAERPPLLRTENGLRARYAKRLSELMKSAGQAVAAHDSRKAVGMNRHGPGRVPVRPGTYLATAGP